MNDIDKLLAEAADKLKIEKPTRDTSKYVLKVLTSSHNPLKLLFLNSLKSYYFVIARNKLVDAVHFPPGYHRTIGPRMTIFDLLRVDYMSEDLWTVPSIHRLENNFLAHNGIELRKAIGADLYDEFLVYDHEMEPCVLEIEKGSTLGQAYDPVNVVFDDTK